MKPLEAEIERIVREVLGRLGSAASQTSGGAASTNNGSATLIFEQRVVTQADLEGRLENKTRVTVLPGAVITPAARDYLRERNIALVRGDTNGQRSSSVRIKLAAAGTTYEPGELIRQLSAEGIDIELLDRGDLLSAVDALAENVARGGFSGVLLTNDPAAALCLANRQPGIRAALAASVVDVEAAILQIGVNMLVIEPTGKSSVALRQMIRRFCSGAPHSCPEALKTRLK